MIKQIGEVAGQIWSILHSHQNMMTANELKRELKLCDFEMYSALGWLARENKVEFIGDAEVIILKDE